MNLTWLEISKKALLKNISQIKKILPKKTKFMAVVKANAYGHGLLEVVGAIKNKVDYLAVFDLDDAILLRKKGVKCPILVLGRVFVEQVNLAIKYDIEVSVTTFDILKINKKLKVHINLDSGLGRDGFVVDDMKKVVQMLKNSSLKIVGLYSHFSAADEDAAKDYTQKQIAELMHWKKEFNALGHYPLVHHCASAGALSSLVKEKFDLVRVGISLYGLWPSEDVKKREEKNIKLQPVLSWKALISEVKFLPKGSAISYNRTHILARDAKVALLPIGYFDGISRVSSNKSFVIIGGKKVPQLGRVTMNLIVLDVTDVKNVKAGDVATVIGDGVSADDWSAWSTTSCYEVVTRINPTISRKVVK